MPHHGVIREKVQSHSHNKINKGVMYSLILYCDYEKMKKKY